MAEKLWHQKYEKFSIIFVDFSSVYDKKVFASFNDERCGVNKTDCLNYLENRKDIQCSCP